MEEVTDAPFFGSGKSEMVLQSSQAPLASLSNEDGSEGDRRVINSGLRHGP
jgi:hypothetical protein